MGASRRRMSGCRATSARAHRAARPRPPTRPPTTPPPYGGGTRQAALEAGRSDPPVVLHVADAPHRSHRVLEHSQGVEGRPVAFPNVSGRLDWCRLREVP